MVYIDEYQLLTFKLASLLREKLMTVKMFDLLAELEAELVRIFSERLKGVYLFGSYARGDQDDESDIDIMVVLDKFERYGAELDRVAELNSNLSLKYGVSVSMIFTRERDWRLANTPLLRNVRQEAIAA